jgi:hypothetical protein
LRLGGAWCRQGRGVVAGAMSARASHVDVRAGRGCASSRAGPAWRDPTPSRSTAGGASRCAGRRARSCSLCMKCVHSFRARGCTCAADAPRRAPWGSARAHKADQSLPNPPTATSTRPPAARQAANIVVATGGEAARPPIPGADLCILSDNVGGAPGREAKRGEPVFVVLCVRVGACVRCVCGVCVCMCVHVHVHVCACVRVRVRARAWFCCR